MKLNRTITTENTPYTYEILQADIDRLSSLYPIMKTKTIGKSVLNRAIYEVTIGSGAYHTHFNASFHGNEWITSAILMKCINTYLINLMNNETYAEFFQLHSISFVPMVNPDGVNLVINGCKSAEKYNDFVLNINDNINDFSSWKANVRGVDLNKQFPALWDIESKRKAQYPKKRDYPGNKPISEPESIAMVNLVENNNFQRMHALHTQGEEIYWGFQGKEPKESEKIAVVYEAASKYEAVRYVDNYAGFKDWFINEYEKPGFTIELGKGVNPLPLDQFDKAYNAMWNIFKANLII